MKRYFMFMSPHDDCCGFISYITHNFNLRSAPKIIPKIARTRRKGPKIPWRVIPISKSDFGDKQITMYIRFEQGIISGPPSPGANGPSLNVLWVSV
jgi:hypothetical protein